MTVGTSTNLVSLHLRENHAVYWTPNGTLIPLGMLPGGRTSYAAIINSKGTIAGTSHSAHGERAVL
ncbi:hypothetical protein ABZ816_36995 [Actinosynnema sp. NPDC047251]|uniref:Uncharacterized protein n=1 Tax=Saccharothrix espanaensis (strain ATCC 51144 / DSM 44229 / JCM 9112 / NBRC 15066 / NRRL 15764) TaxID=1179773 RepID=K0K2W7_SACES|nr:hypothetical protein [Saccharothrix espanaensis]CCH32626.1 hypothetical protein BN6_53660 [Saccharothrix espanaensis DSM 44229]